MGRPRRAAPIRNPSRPSSPAGTRWEASTENPEWQDPADRSPVTLRLGSHALQIGGCGSRLQGIRFIPRKASARLRALLARSPAVLIQGPRQCGKTTLVRKLFPDWKHVDLERPADFDAIHADIEGFFDAYPDHVILDEAQRLPEVFSVLRHVIDRKRRNGRFILLGSAGGSLMRTASESLAGRVSFLELTPLRLCELAGTRRESQRWFWGGYPPVLGSRAFDGRAEWLDGYVTTFLERDLPALGVRLPSHRLRKLWTMLTHVHGNLLNASDLARSLVVSTHTINHYLDVLEGAFLIRRLQPLHANVQKRLTKSPKVYIRDSGLLHFLAGLRHPGELETWSRRGHSFEGLVIEEIATLAGERVVRPEVCFWRTQAGGEVDLVIRDGTRLVPIEIKLGVSVDQHALRGLRQFMKDLGVRKGWVVATASERRRVGRAIEIVPWREVVSGTVTFGFGRR